ncbi:hypothetical protein O0L34_g1888 [Tuta absoluta]|nr:hypothetical protein O0L34_g1888 [Tuta absoluta]
MLDLWKVLLILSVFCVIFVKATVLQDLGDGEDFNDRVFENPREPITRTQMTGSVYNNVKRYYCGLGASDLVGLEPFKILYATNEWRFPRQDVNLTLAYPTSSNVSEYVITSMELFLFYDGISTCHGYLTGGGMGWDRISMTFTIPRISRLYYQFRLLGVEKNLFDRTANVFSNATQLC